MKSITYTIQEFANYLSIRIKHSYVLICADVTFLTVQEAPPWRRWETPWPRIKGVLKGLQIQSL